MGCGMDVDDMPMSQGTKNAIRRARWSGAFHVVIDTSEDLADFRDEDLLAIRHIGKTRLREIREALARIPEPDRSWMVGA